MFNSTKISVEGLIRTRFRYLRLFEVYNSRSTKGCRRILSEKYILLGDLKEECLLFSVSFNVKSC